MFLYLLVKGGIFGRPPLVVLCTFPLALPEPLCPSSSMVLPFLKVTGVDSSMGLPYRATALLSAASEGRKRSIPAALIAAKVRSWHNASDCVWVGQCGYGADPWRRP